MAAYIVIEHREVPAGHVGDRDVVGVDGQLVQDAAHRNDIVIGMG
jgi:hypothetical protein